MRNRGLNGYGVIALIIAIAIFGCGGGGGGGGGTSTGSSLYSNVVTLTRATGLSTAVLNSSEFYPGDTTLLTASATYASPTGSYSVTLTPSNFVVQGGTTVGSVDSAGNFTLSATPNTIATVTASSVAGTITWNIHVLPQPTNPIVTGLVRANDVSNSPLAGVIVNLFDATNAQVASGTSGSDGQFSISTPSSATYFKVDLSQVASASETFYPYYYYGTGEYDSTNALCKVSLPTFTTPHRYVLGHDLVVPVKTILSPSGGILPPPPPPAACFNSP